ncbi:MAG: histidine kinase [Gammaproteobacteria bacterium]|nr:histidine kinase [Gammaproteobacteria bacterium]
MSNHLGAPHGMIPNLCILPGAFLVVLFSVSLSLLISLLSTGPNESFWYTFGLTSSFVLWVTCLSTLILCWLRNRLNTLSAPATTSFVLLVIGLTTVIASLLTLRFVFIVSLEFDNTAQWWFVGRNVFVAEMVASVWLRYLYLEQQMQSSIKAESEAQFKALQAKIQPHFFFNTLNTIASLIHIAPNRAEKTIEQLADIFRASLNPKQQLISLEEEVSLCKAYLKIEQERLGDKLTVNWDIGIDLEMALIPPFTLQPIIENAVYHGIQQISSGGTIFIKMNVSDRKVVIQVSNPFASNTRQSGNQMALDNIRKRLFIRYQQSAKLTSRQDENDYIVTLELPLEKSEGQKHEHLDN